MPSQPSAARTRWPLVSVVIPSHDYGHFVGEAIDSVLSQTYEAVEAIVVDDGSADDTQQVLARYGSRIRTVRLDGRGVSVARNEGFNVSTGEFVVFLDADDLLLPDAIAAQVAHFEQHPDADAVHGQWYHCDVRRCTWRLAGNPHQVGDILRHIVLGNVAAIHAVMTRRRTIAAAGGFDPAVSYTADWEMWLRLATRGHRFGFVRRPVAVYRVHGSGMAGKLDRATRDVLYVLEKYFNDPAIAPTLRRLRRQAYFTWHRYLAMARLAQADAEGAVPHLRESVRLSPGALRSTDLSRRVVKAMWYGARRIGPVDADAVGDAGVAMMTHLAGPGGPGARVRAASHLGAALTLSVMGARKSGARHLLAAARASWRAALSRDALHALVRILPPGRMARTFLDGDQQHARRTDRPLPALVESVVHSTKP
jgi:glycosyltransferase involved in cell wall biosynthesis